MTMTQWLETRRIISQQNPTINPLYIHNSSLSFLADAYLTNQNQQLTILMDSSPTMYLPE
jgi:uncharacterized protein YqkB